MNKDRVFFAACLSVVFFFACVGWARTPTAAPVEEWHRTTVDCPPPEGRPIIAFWIWDGQPSPCCVVPIADKYYAYRAEGPTELIADYPPAYWIDMPGTVR